MGSENYLIELAILDVISKLNTSKARILTFGNIYMELVRTHKNIPSIKDCVIIVNAMVAESLLVSDRTLEHDPSFPYTQHLISGLTEIGVAALEAYAMLGG